MRKNSIVSRVLRIVGVVVGVIALLWFLLPFLAAGILNIGNLTGIVVAVLLVIYLAFLPVIHERIRKWWKDRRMKCLMGGCAMIIMVIVLLATVETGCIIRANMKKPEENATAVVLGCRVYGERASLSLVERLEAAYEYLKEHPNAVCVVSGGQGDGENISEAECMYRWLIAKGIEAKRIYKEESSTSTEENIMFSKEVIQENGLNEEIAIITSEYHSYRAGMIAKENGMTYGSVPGQTAIWLLPTFYIRELYAILAEWIF